MTDDAALARSAAGGDAAAFEALYDRHAAAVYRYLAVRVGDAARAEDLTQDVFLGAYRGLRGFKGRGSLRAWLLRVAHNRLANHWRTLSRRPREEPLPAPGSANGPRWTIAGPEDALVDDPGGEAVARAVAHLTDAQREAIALRFVLELTVAETAAVMGRSTSAVKNLQHDALAAFRRALVREESRP